MLGKPLPQQEEDVAPAALSGPPAAQYLVTCPGCGRTIRLTGEELGATVECSKCSTRFIPNAKAPAEQPTEVKQIGGAGRRPGEKYCHECGAIIRTEAAICPMCGTLQPEWRAPWSGDEDHPNDEYSKETTLPTVLAWLSPASLVVAVVLRLLHDVAWRHIRLESMDVVRGFPTHFPKPTELVVLNGLAWLSMAVGLGITVVAFVVGIMRNHKLAIVLSSVTFVLSLLLMFISVLYFGFP
jgi:hypothetical protein